MFLNAKYLHCSRVPFVLFRKYSTIWIPGFVKSTFHPRSIFFYRERFKFEKKFQKSLISNLSTCGFHDVSNARTTCAIFSLRGPSMSAFIALPSKSSGSATNTPASFRLGKQTDFSSPSVFPSFSHLGELSKPYIGSIGFPRERKNLCSEHWPPHRLFQLTIPHRVNDLCKNSYTRPTRSYNFQSFLSCILRKYIIHLRYISLSDAWKVIEHRNWAEFSNRSFEILDYDYLRYSIVVLSIHPSNHRH